MSDGKSKSVLTKEKKDLLIDFIRQKRLYENVRKNPSERHTCWCELSDKLQINGACGILEYEFNDIAFWL